MDGIYIAYVTGADGYSAILFVLRNSRVTGADIGGMKYSGSYKVHEEKLIGNINAEVPPNTTLISGYSTGDASTQFSMPFEISFQSIGNGYINIDSPFGKINASINKINELP